MVGPLPSSCTKDKGPHLKIKIKCIITIKKFLKIGPLSSRCIEDKKLDHKVFSKTPFCPSPSSLLLIYHVGNGTWRWGKRVLGKTL